MSKKYFINSGSIVIKKIMTEKPENVGEQNSFSIRKDCNDCTDYCRLEKKCTLNNCKIRVECRECEYRSKGSLYCSVCYKKLYQEK